MKPGFLLALISGSSLVVTASNALSKSPAHLSVGSTDLEAVQISMHNAPIAQDPIHMDVMPPSGGQSSPRHRQEKVHLLKRMDRKSGKWGTSHPRYRLLEALWGYSRYRGRNMADLDKWRTLYKSVGKKQKKVSLPGLGIRAHFC
jgi:hypothetical protein